MPGQAGPGGPLIKTSTFLLPWWRRPAVFAVAGVLLPAVYAGAARAEFDTLIDHSPGQDAISWEPKAAMNLQTDTVLADGKVKTKPGDFITYERTAINDMRLWGTMPVASSGMRWSLFTRTAYRKTEGDAEPRQITERQWVRGHINLDYVLKGNNALEIFVGVRGHVIPEHDQVTESASVTTNETFSEVTYGTAHVGVFKRAGTVAGGFYYHNGADTKRQIAKTTEQDPTVNRFQETLQDADRVAMFFRMNMGKGFLFGEFAAIQASEGGNRTDTGKSVLEDYTLARMLWYQPIGPLGQRLTVMHKTLSYADNQNVTMETIPMTSAHWKLMIGPWNRNLFAGIIYAYGQDGQSIPEFNADYSIQVFGASAGFNLSF